MEELIIKAKKGDKESFSKLIHIYQNDLYKIARTRLNEEEDIYDAIQDTIISSYESVSKLHKISSFKSWLIKILINKCNDIYRRKKYYVELEENTIITNTDLSGNDINDLFKKLSADEKSIILLHFIEGFSFKEISKILHINENTVRSKLHRAKFKINNYNKEE